MSLPMVGLAASLPKLNLATEYTVSGISSGGYMAGQYHLSHAGEVIGVGIIAGGPYDCAEGSLGTALSRCVGKTDESLSVPKLLARAKARSEAGGLAPVDQWPKAKIWLFHGTADKTVARAVSDGLYTFYQSIVPAANLRYVKEIAVAHGFPTLTAGNQCNTSESPFINACQYDAAGDMLQHLLGKLEPPASAAKGKLMDFSQEAYSPDGDLTLADTGFVYVPANCEKGERCQLHIAFHGCQQHADAIGERFVREAGYNAWAESNRLVILYPQTKSSLLPLNPKACWDWWGYTGSDYATKKGNQIATVAAMVAALRR